MQTTTSRTCRASQRLLAVGLCLGSLGLAACASSPTEQGPHTEELRALFEADQAVRASGFQGMSPDEIRAVVASDTLRRERVLELLAQDALQHPGDLYHAAMVLQHGSDPADFLMAHVLAAAAAQDGFEPARWLSAASLDRYLMSVDQPQVFRTQYNSMNNEPWTQDPSLDLLGDGLRERFGVPSLESAKAQLDEMNAASGH